MGGVRCKIWQIASIEGGELENMGHRSLLCVMIKTSLARMLSYFVGTKDKHWRNFNDSATVDGLGCEDTAAWRYEIASECMFFESSFVNNSQRQKGGLKLKVLS